MSLNANLPGAIKPARVEWLDLFRGAAVVAMIEAHVVNTFLAPAFRDAVWFGWLNWFNGLVAPSFLFIAGWAQGLSWSVAGKKRVAFGRKLKRLLGVAALGYFLHFPWTELGQRRWTEALRVGTQVDVLPCLAAALFLVLGIQWVAQRSGEKWRVWWWFTLLGGFAVALVGLAPATRAWTAGPIPVVAFVNQTTGSLFPLLPWAGFVFAGAILGSVRTRPTVALLVAFGLLRMLGRFLEDGNFSADSPAFFCDRLAWVAVLAVLCQWFARIWQPTALLFAGRESLVMYAVHLQVISWIGQAGGPVGRLGWAAVGGMYALVLALTWAVALGWAGWRARNASRQIAAV